MAQVQSRPRPPSVHEQVQCPACRRWRLKSEPCWFCEPPWPDPCVCDDWIERHIHLEHALLERLSQLDYESIDEAILLPTENWPSSPDDVVDFEHEELVGIANAGPMQSELMRFKPRPIPWREAPEYQAFLGRYPELRAKARQGIDSIFSFFNLTPSEADVWSLDAAGYTPEWIAARLGYKPGGVDQLRASVASKVAARLARLDALAGGGCLRSDRGSSMSHFDLDGDSGVIPPIVVSK